ncbi:hypothetical protein FDI40_gp438 [Agrobacterium phage Atu_ph07]|uniref:Uncharacterized protein n=1 Tax=Agrobacterium phage Atu_ph07 TaxID=2024264 RepID=A0A2L0V086_9CAUD|nr:hypothetical protein FDI40_gp438 [Agrobacterium phage Atu_ph07]AUZ95197.1 hypothetical protein [Agrobacterium phage Atu_ph07]
MQYFVDVMTIATFLNNDIRLSLGLQSHVKFERYVNNKNVIPIKHFKITSQRYDNILKYGVAIEDQHCAYMFFDKIFNLVYDRRDTLTFLYNGEFNMYFSCEKPLYDEIAPVC